MCEIVRGEMNGMMNDEMNGGYSLSFYVLDHVRVNLAT